MFLIVLVLFIYPCSFPIATKNTHTYCTYWLAQPRRGEMPCFSWLNPGQIVIHRGAFGPLQPAVVGILSNGSFQRTHYTHTHTRQTLVRSCSRLDLPMLGKARGSENTLCLCACSVLCYPILFYRLPLPSLKLQKKKNEDIKEKEDCKDLSILLPTLCCNKVPNKASVSWSSTQHWSVLIAVIAVKLLIENVKPVIINNQLAACVNKR